MKNSEEDILKRFLQDTFSDYEPEPSDLTWESIRKEIQPQQPNVGVRLRQWIVPVVALLLLIGGFVFNREDAENKAELTMNSIKENASVTIRSDGKRPSEGQLPYVKKDKRSEKIYVNKAASKVESTVILKVEKSLKLPTFSTILNEPIVKQNVQEYVVSMKAFVGIEDKSVVAPVVVSSHNELFSNLNLDSSDSRIIGLNAQRESQKSTNPNSESVIAVVSIPNDHSMNNTDNNVVNNDNNVEEKSFKSINLTNPSSIAVVSVPTDHSTDNAIVEEVRYIKPLETLKNKDFVLVKNELAIPQISQININQEVKPIRRPLYVSMSIMPLQTYRILTVNSKDIQNLQTNKLFDSERNGFAFELGITKSIGQKWNLRSSVSYLKMRQWAEYQVNTNNISVKNSNNFSNTVSVGNNDNEFIGQTRIEAKTLQMVGLNANIQRFFKITGRNRYFISGGSQLMIEPNERQTNIFINASAGFQHLVNKDCFLTIEPTASYLLNNINDSRSLIQTNAYNLGLKVGLNFRVK